MYWHVPKQISFSLSLLEYCMCKYIYIYTSISRFIIYLYDKAGFVPQGGGVPFSFYSGVAALYVRICLLLWWLMVTELPLQILPWEDAYPLHVHMVGLPKNDTNYRRTLNPQASEKCNNENFGSSSPRSWSSRFFLGLFDVVHVVVFNQSPSPTRLKRLVEWTHCRWSALGMMNVWMPSAKTNG